MNWNELRSYGNSPYLREGLTLNYCYNCLYVFAGKDGYRYYNDVWCYRLDKRFWDEIIDTHDNTGVRPNPRYNHTCVVYREYIILFGGKGTINNKSKDLKYFNDIWMFNTTSNRWKEIKYDISDGIYPCGREGHSMNIINDNIFIIGGQSMDNYILNDVYCINAKNIINDNKPHWIKVDIKMPHLHKHLTAINSMRLHIFSILVKYMNSYYKSLTYRLFIFGGNGKYNTPTKNLTVFNRIDLSFNPTKSEYFFNGFITQTLGDHIPIEITNIIKYFCGFTTPTTNELNGISSRASHGGGIISHNNASHLFIYGGISLYVPTKDTILVKLD